MAKQTVFKKKPTKGKKEKVPKSERCFMQKCKERALFKLSVDTGVVLPCCEEHTIIAFRGYLKSVLSHNRGVYVQRFKE